MPVDDAYTVSLLHMDGADASTTFTDESGKTWTENGNAQIDTAQSKFGGASGLFDGTGDYISALDSADWQLDGGSNSNSWTIDFWIRFNGDPGAGNQGIFQQRVDNNNFWGIALQSNVLYFQVRSGGVDTVTIGQTFNPTDATWYHVAIVKNGTAGYMHFIDGVQVGSTTTDTDVMPNFAGDVTIGRYTGSAGTNQELNGWLDEFRISKGIARWTANFTPPTYAYGLRISSTYGGFTYTGQIAGLLYNRFISAVYGAFAYTGQAINLALAKGILAAYGAYTYTGNSILLAAVKFFEAIYLLSTNNSISVIGQDNVRTILSADNSKKVRE